MTGCKHWCERESEKDGGGGGNKANSNNRKRKFHLLKKE